ncbi:4-hydroxybenzoate octaprenyltransferase [Paraglaciecola hydrolytica]|uniref:4-hydroxybenzoate octaprenyltransferase n=1 Tax=Paraglaciecola hydrolytica TaxID=1799789 RepID=A0A136A3I7_9ALTE|nr:4-hydroxybenzoate octaprenyltransferase [Paraglaciecola hydrolytica]KXI29793.1 4-hydroxybenzoate octaprenyltransferase [Paraglaciecola hydrolytica]
MTNNPTKVNRWSAYWRLMRFDKPIGIYLLLWPCLWALWIAAQGIPPLDILVIFILGVIVMRAAGCVINDYADRKVDGAVQRTAQRPLATGELSSRQALWCFALLVFCALCLVLWLNWQTIVLSLGALVLTITYPFMKRYTHLPQVVLGAAFGWSIPMAFMAINQQLNWLAWVLYAANLCWTVAYDTQYAMVDRDDDLRIGVKSTAILFGQFDKLIILLLQLATLGLLLVVAINLAYGWPVYLALLIGAGLFVYHQCLIKDRERNACFKAFLHNHYFGLVIAIGIALQYWLNP